jgi:hypothetical protein
MAQLEEHLPSEHEAQYSTHPQKRIITINKYYLKTKPRTDFFFFLVTLGFELRGLNWGLNMSHSTSAFLGWVFLR